MKTVIAGNGSNSTAAVLAWLAAGNQFHLANLYLIGEPDQPRAIWLTDWETPLSWPVAGTFLPAVISRGTISSKIGLEVQSLDVSWTPRAQPATQSIATASPYQLARMGYYDNWPVRVWSVYMPTPGDANTYGCSEAFGGRVASVTIQRGALKFKVNSFLDCINQQVPTNVIEVLNTAAAYTGASPPKGFVNIPQFIVQLGSSTNVVVGFQTFPDPGSILDTNNVQGGYLVFNGGPDSTLAGVWSAIQQNTSVAVGGGTYNQFVLYAPLPFPPSLTDTFYVSGPAPINRADGDLFGGSFPFVPNPETGW
jgi:Uncharacterized conserved protein (DUF2163)